MARQASGSENNTPEENPSRNSSESISLSNALTFLSFDINHVVAVFPDTLVFGKVYLQRGSLYFESVPFFLAPKRMKDFFRALESLSEHFAKKCAENETTKYLFSPYEVTIRVSTVRRAS